MTHSKDLPADVLLMCSSEGKPLWFKVLQLISIRFYLVLLNGSNLK